MFSSIAIGDKLKQRAQVGEVVLLGNEMVVLKDAKTYTALIESEDGTTSWVGCSKLKAI
ncbi:hypothetical protein [Streptomyces sp. CoH17]|uniref:hypothetical protein n=1 Tax=Streptomyces sp. CoH17 TaxID=2992806 RepID=UPI00226F8AB2|nr:hypothetical protein [Streptomyces sp. CoH17]